MFEIIAITVVITFSVFNFIFTYAVAKVVYERTEVLSLLARAVSLLTELYSGLNTTTDKEDKE